MFPDTSPVQDADAEPIVLSALEMPSVKRLQLAGMPSVVDTLLIGLGFEDRTPISFDRLLSATRPKRILAARYAIPGHADGMLAKAASEGIVVEELPYDAVRSGTLPKLEGEVVVDITGLAKPALFKMVRSGLLDRRSLTIAYTAAERYSPNEAELQAVLDAHASYNRHETLAALKSVLTGEQGPYSPISLLTTESDGTRKRGLCAFASAKHERILHLMEAREYDAVELMVDAADTARAKVAEMAGRVALEESRAGELVSADASDLEAILSIIARTHQSWYVDGGFNFELGLTGNKIQATAAAILSSILPVNEVWYVAPATFDANRFTQGVGETTLYQIERRDPLG